MKKKLLLVIPLVLVIGILLGVVILYDLQGMGRALPRAQQSQLIVGKDFAFSSEVLDILRTELDGVEALAREHVIEQAAASLSVVNNELSIQQIQVLDEKWGTLPASDESIAYFLTNAAAQRLQAFQRENPRFVEIFLTDRHGLNVAMTNKTSDYFQGDETWWTQAYHDNEGLSYVGVEEFDESAGINSIPLYVPVYSDNQLVGIIKAVLSIPVVEH